MSIYSEKIKGLIKNRDFFGLTEELRSKPSFDTTGISDEAARKEIAEDEEAYEKAYNEKVKKPNPNVMLELGIAYGFGIPVLILLKKGTKVISDIQGTHRIDYKTPEDLVKRLDETNLDKIIGG